MVSRSPTYDLAVPRYDYRCASCDDTFEVRRSMADDSPVQCPAGHADVKRLLSVFASVGTAGGSEPAPAPAMGGGCCGGACGCG